MCFPDGINIDKTGNPGLYQLIYRTCVYFHDADVVDIRSFYPSWFDSPKEFEEFLFFSSDDSQKAYFLYHGPTPFDLLEMMTFLSEQKGCFMESGLLGYFAKIVAHFEYDDYLMFSNCPLNWKQDYFRWVVFKKARSMMFKSCENVQQAAHKTMLGSALPEDIVWEINQKYLALRASDNEKNQKLVREYMENREVASYEHFPDWRMVLMRNQDMLWNLDFDRENDRLVRLVKVCREIKYFLAYVGLSRGVFVTVRWIARKLASRNKC